MSSRQKRAARRRKAANAKASPESAAHPTRSPDYSKVALVVRWIAGADNLRDAFVQVQGQSRFSMKMLARSALENLGAVYLVSVIVGFAGASYLKHRSEHHWNEMIEVVARLDAAHSSPSIDPEAIAVQLSALGRALGVDHEIGFTTPGVRPEQSMLSIEWDDTWQPLWFHDTGPQFSDDAPEDGYELRVVPNPQFVRLRKRGGDVLTVGDRISANEMLGLEARFQRALCSQRHLVTFQSGSRQHSVELIVQGTSKTASDCR